MCGYVPTCQSLHATGLAAGLCDAQPVCGQALQDKGMFTACLLRLRLLALYDARLT